MSVPGLASNQVGRFPGRGLARAFSPAAPVVKRLPALEASVAALFEDRTHLRTIHCTRALGTYGSVLLSPVKQFKPLTSPGELSGCTGYAGSGHTADGNVVSPG